MTLRQHKNKLVKDTKIEERNINFFNVKVFSHVPEILRLTQEDEGKRIWLADEYKTKRVTLQKYNEDSFDITYAGEKKYRSVYPQEAVLHPSEITEERLEKFGYEIKDGRKNA